MRYLLSIDRSLGRVSLRKMSARVQNAKNRVRPRAKKTPPETTGPTKTTTPALVLMAIVASATIIGVLLAFQGSDSNVASVPQAAAARLTAAPPAPPLDTTRDATEAVPTATTARVRTPDTPTASTGTIDVSRPHAVEPPPHPDAVPHADAIPHAAPRLPANSVPNAKLMPAASPKPIAPAVTNEDSVTISGCLQAHDGSFWLKDPLGANAPTSRSWKSGFLKKHAEPVQVVDAARTLQLSNYVAQRVSATGTLGDRTIQARSLERVAASCH